MLFWGEHITSVQVAKFSRPLHRYISGLVPHSYQNAHGPYFKSNQDRTKYLQCILLTVDYKYILHHISYWWLPVARKLICLSDLDSQLNRIWQKRFHEKSHAQHYFALLRTRPVQCIRTDADEITAASGKVVEHSNVIENNRPANVPSLYINFLFCSFYNELKNVSATEWSYQTAPLLILGAKLLARQKRYYSSLAYWLLRNECTIIRLLVCAVTRL